MNWERLNRFLLAGCFVASVGIVDSVIQYTHPERGKSVPQFPPIEGTQPKYDFYKGPEIEDQPRDRFFKEDGMKSCYDLFYPGRLFEMNPNLKIKEA